MEFVIWVYVGAGMGSMMEMKIHSHALDFGRGIFITKEMDINALRVEQNGILNHTQQI